MPGRFPQEASCISKPLRPNVRTGSANHHAADMLFNSLHFLIFFPVVTALYFLLPHRFRWMMLLAASCYFYMVFRPVYILILFFTILVDYVAGILIENSEGRRRRFYLIASIGANVGVLAVFKYYNFLNESLRGLLDMAGLALPVPPLLSILLPVGLSFHTFQSLSYTIEVYRGHTPAERHAGIFALYVMFYPQLVAGPIERPQNLLWQFREEHRFEYERVVAGLQLMLWGMFKKVVIADRLAPFVNLVYDDPRSYTGISLIVATVFFAFQIYCDFSGYSDIALGSAQVMGFKLMRNFNRPYFSKSISEFWKRWHISLSTWFRDYLYISLGGNRRTPPRVYFNLFFTFLVSGLWHGANWTYVVWGALNGFYLIAEIQAQRLTGGNMLRRLTGTVWEWPVRAVQVGVTFALVCFAWIFFRANSLADAFYIVTHLFDGFSTLPTDVRSLAFLKMNVLMRRDKWDFIIAVWAVALLLVVHFAQRRRGGRETLARQPAAVRWGLYYATVIAILFFGAFNESQQFIYFQF
ncbi:MAG TPA: MBOAT family O-acyltransferase [Pyrinomonadaceae bacterium]|nr:MBOAT family O-acyltransferase [Pyrinomonadaceae bacterium]